MQKRNLRSVALRGDRRFGRRRLGVAMICAALALMLLGLNMLMRPGAAPVTAGVSLDAVKSAYADVVAGETRAPDLTRLGFDASQPGVQRLSYLGLMEYFAPKDSAAFDRLDPAARQCLSVPDGCSAYLFRLARQSDVQASFSFVDAAHAADVPGVEVLFLVHDGRVAYKAMRGA